MDARRLSVALATCAIACVGWWTSPAAAQYSDTDINDDITAAARQSLSQDALRSHDRGGGGAGGPDVSLRIVFPAQQTGLSNIEMTELYPRESGAHNCEAIAVKSGGNVISATFIPKKDVRPGYDYDVVVSDSMGDLFGVGRIHVSGASEQAYQINAPMLTPGSPHYAPAQNLPPAAATTQQANVGAFGLAVLAQSKAASAIGLRGATVTPQLLALAGAQTRSFHGVIVSKVDQGGFAAGAGLRPGDVIFTANGKPCASIQQLAAITQDESAPAKVIELAYLRSGQNGPVVHHAQVPSARLVALVGAMQRAAVSVPSLQLTAVTITPALLALSGAPAKSFNGVGVFEVQKGGLAARSGLGEGDIIVDVDGQPCATVQQLTAMLQRFGANGQPVNLTVGRHDAQGALHTRQVMIVLGGG